MPITLHPVTADNWHACIHLHPAACQHDLVASNLYSIAQSAVEPACVPMAIQQGRTVVGFLMFEPDPDTGGWWLSRFMIDHRYQGRGYGQAALAALIDRLQTRAPDAVIRLSIVPWNRSARALYEAAGFRFTGEHHGDELVMALEP
jgi:diamine N-acetyltransferase